MRPTLVAVNVSLPPGPFPPLGPEQCFLSLDVLWAGHRRSCRECWEKPAEETVSESRRGGWAHRGAPGMGTCVRVTSVPVVK